MSARSLSSSVGAVTVKAVTAGSDVTSEDLHVNKVSLSDLF